MSQVDDFGHVGADADRNEDGFAVGQSTDYFVHRRSKHLVQAILLWSAWLLLSSCITYLAFQYSEKRFDQRFDPRDLIDSMALEI